MWRTRGNHRIQAFTAEGTFLRQWGSEGSGAGQFDCPYWHRGGRRAGPSMWRTRDNHRIQAFTAEGTFLRQWGSGAAEQGSSTIPLASRWTERSGTVYVADTGNHRIQAFTAEGTFLRQWGSRAAKPGQFDHPSGIAVDEERDRLCGGHGQPPHPGLHLRGDIPAPVGEQGSGARAVRLSLWHRGGRERDRLCGGHVATTASRPSPPRARSCASGGAGSGAGQFYYPSGIAVDGSGTVYVADTYNHRIQAFTSEGTFLRQWGSRAAEQGSSSHPSGIAVDEERDRLCGGHVATTASRPSPPRGRSCASGGAGQRSRAVLDVPRASRWTGAGPSMWRTRGNDRIQVFAPDHPDPAPGARPGAQRLL